MKFGMFFYRFGILGLLFAPGVFFEEPLKTYIAQNHDALTNLILLYGFPVLVGFSMLAMSQAGFKSPDVRIARLLNILSGVTVAWLLLWCVLWFGIGSQAGNPADLVMQYKVFIGFLGWAVGVAGTVWGWKAPDLAKKTTRLMVVSGWNITFVSFLNLHLEPTMRHLLGPGFGGLLIITGVYFVTKDL